mmetsp:Transcript_52032/g.100567  ORF Transcript_52032/g.100567 Transcript_52032/m.100567 type:complete len:286 (-) Transcript_52032:406-1263(-)
MHPHLGIDAKHIDTSIKGFNLVTKVARTTMRKVNQWNVRASSTNLLSCKADVRRSKAHPLLGTQTMCPRVKQLDTLGTAAHLEDCIIRNRHCHPPKELICDGRLLIHPTLENCSILGAAAFNCVGSESPWSTDEAKQRAGTFCLFPQPLKALPQESVGRLEVFRLRNLPDCLGSLQAVLKAPAKVSQNHRTPATNDIKLNAECRKRSQNVRKDDHSVHAKTPPTLKRKFNGHVGRLRPLPKWVSLRISPKCLHVAAGLSHEPDWCVATARLSTRNSQKEIRRCGC